MKKTYINPDMEVIKVTTGQIMAGSPSVDIDSSLVDPGSADGRELEELLGIFGE